VIWALSSSTPANFCSGRKNFTNSTSRSRP
jgi:hypothetical protein